MKKEREILNSLQRRVAELEIQKAKLGINADPSISIQIEDTYKEIHRLMIRDIVVQEMLPPLFLGLIVLVGPGRAGSDPLEQSAMDAILYHVKGLKYCWLIGSSGEKGSVDVVEAIQEECKHLQIQTYTYFVDEPMDINPTYALAEKIYSDDVPAVGLTDQDVIADITGATKPMSFGLLRACGVSRPMQYMVRQPKGRSKPMMLKYHLSILD
jgi:hypothetical protein